MGNHFFRFKQFVVWHNKCAMKVGTDGVLLGAWVQPEKAVSILDIGTGSGLLALMLAQKTTAHIDALDMDTDACIQARENVNNSPWSSQISVIQSSFQQYYPLLDEKYDLIISNPPFFNNSLKTPHENRNTARHADVLPFGELLAGVTKLLSGNGRFCIVLPYVEAQMFIVDAALAHLYCNKKLNIKTVIHKKPNRVLMQFTKLRSAMDESELAILDINNNYTTEYKNLTKDYYLNF